MTAAPRIVEVATAIHKIQVRNTAITTRVRNIEEELTRLQTEAEKNHSTLAALAREMDKLTV